MESQVVNARKELEHSGDPGTQSPECFPRHTDEGGSTAPSTDQPMVVDSRSSRAHLLFMQVCEKVRAQTAKDSRKKGLLDLVQIVTQEKKGDVVEGGQQSPRKDRGEQGGEPGDEPPDGQQMRETTVQANLEALRREFKDELDQLRAEMQAYIDRAIQSLESRTLSQSSTFQRHPLQGVGATEQLLQAGDQSLEGRHKSLSVPSLLPGKAQAPNRLATTTRPQARRTKSETLNLSREAVSQSPEYKAMRNTRLKKAAGNLPPTRPSLQLKTGLTRSSAKAEQLCKQEHSQGREPLQKQK